MKKKCKPKNLEDCNKGKLAFLTKLTCNRHLVNHKSFLSISNKHVRCPLRKSIKCTSKRIVDSVSKFKQVKAENIINVHEMEK